MATEKKTEAKSEKKKPAAKKKSAAKVVESSARIADYGILIRPIITEKTTGSPNLVGFLVNPRASKTEIRAAVERVFNVKVARVNTCNTLGKIKRTSRSSGRRAETRKAYVTLVEGSKIELVEGV